MHSSSSRSVYRHAQSRRLFHPKSVAIVGASANPGSFGARTRSNLRNYNGRVHLVNGKYQDIHGEPCHASLSAIGEVPDCVFVAVPREALKPVVAECVALGVGGVVIFASGLGETGDPAHQALQQELAQMVEGSSTLLLGPNCLGTINALNGLLGTFANVPQKMHLPGTRTIGLIAQSGALGVGLAQAVERGVSFSHVLMSGNACDVDVADQIAYLAEDPECQAIACVFEGIAHPGRLIEAGALARQNGKAVVAVKLGISASGAEAALSHTGALAGSAAGYRALFERAGIIVIDHFEDLLETACFFAKAPRATAPGVAVLTPSGGAGIMAADEAEVYGVPLPQPDATLKSLLESHIPEFGAARNPCDVTAQILSNPASFPACAEAFLEKAEFGAIVTPYNTARLANAQRNLELGELANKHGKIACVYSLCGWQEGPGTREMELSPNVALFRSTSRCFSTLAEWSRWSQGAGHPSEATPPGLTEPQRAAVRHELDASPEQTLSEGLSKRLLEACGVSVVGNRLVNSAEAALDAAATLGYPVALKVDSSDIPHKTDAGVLRLNLKDEAAVRGAYEAVMANALKATSADRINGVLVQPMIPSGVEILVGARVDPLFGPMIVVGMGGILVELLQDSVVSLAPVDRAGAKEMLGRLRCRALLEGFRGGEPVDLEALAQTVSSISVLISEERERIAEIDVNPIICNGSRVVAVDGLVVKSKGCVQAG